MYVHTYMCRMCVHTRVICTYVCRMYVHTCVICTYVHVSYVHTCVCRMLERVVSVFRVKHHLIVGVFCVKHHLIVHCLLVLGVRCGCSLPLYATFVLDAAILLFYMYYCGCSLSCLQLFRLYESVSQTLPKEGVPYDVATCESMIASFDSTQKQTRSAAYECKKAILSLKDRMQEATVTAKRSGIILDYFKAGSFMEKKADEIDKKLEEVEVVMSSRETLLKLNLKMRHFELQTRKVSVVNFVLQLYVSLRHCVIHQ